MDFWYSFSKSILRTYMAVFIRSIHIRGQDKIQPGPKIFVANHPNVTDAFILPFIVREKLHFLVQAEAFNLPILGRLLKLADQIPVARNRGQEALASAREKLTDGHAVAIFPEGRLSPAEGFRRPASGAARLALETGAPLVPIGFFVPPKFTRSFRGDFFDRGAVGRIQMGGQCFVQIGDPWRMNVARKVDQSYRNLRELTENLMDRIAALVQQAQKHAEGLGSFVQGDLSDTPD